MTTRSELETQLADATSSLADAVEVAEMERRRRDDLIRRIRSIPDPPSARYVAEIADVSHTIVLRLGPTS